MRGRNAVDAFAPIFAQAYTEWLESTKDLKSKDARQGGDQSCEEKWGMAFLVGSGRNCQVGEVH